MKEFLNRKYLDVTVTRKDGSKFSNPLKLSEAHFVSQLAQEHLMVVVSLSYCSDKEYKLIFG